MSFGGYSVDISVWQQSVSGDEPLLVKPDGTIMNGNTRILALQSRGYDVNSLIPRLGSGNIYTIQLTRPARSTNSSINPTMPDRVPKPLIIWDGTPKQRFDSLHIKQSEPPGAGVYVNAILLCDRDLQRARR